MNALQSCKGGTLKRVHLSNRRVPDDTIVRIIPLYKTPSARVLRTLAAFGVGVRRMQRREKSADRSRAEVVSEVVKSASKPRTVILLNGMSGCGKSSHLRAARIALVQKAVPTRLLDLGRWATRAESSSVLDAVQCPCDQAIDLLNAVGLGDALLLAQDPNTLSEGQSARLRIASAIASLMRSRDALQTSPRHSVLFIDEFASVLDRATARALCQAIARVTRAVGNQSLSIVLATAHDDVREWLSPDLTVSFGQWGEVSFECDQ